MGLHVRGVAAGPASPAGISNNRRQLPTDSFVHLRDGSVEPFHSEKVRHVEIPTYGLLQADRIYFRGGKDTFLSALRLAVLVVVLLLPCWGETGRVSRADGSQVTWYLDRPSKASFPVVVILQGSECLKVSHKYGEMIGDLTARGVGVLRVEKPGLHEDVPVGDCPPDYLRLNTPDRRVLDLLMVLGELRRSATGFNGSVGLLGGSEGAMIAALAAPLCSDLRGVVLLSGGGGGAFSEEVLGSVRMHMTQSGAPERAIEERLDEMRSMIEVIRKDPVPSKEWLSDGELARSTYLWWASAWDLQMSTPLLRVDAPILAWQGETDASVPQASGLGLAEKMKAAGKDNFELRTYPGGHAPPPEVLSESIEWMVRHLR